MIHDLPYFLSLLELLGVLVKVEALQPLVLESNRAGIKVLSLRDPMKSKS